MIANTQPVNRPKWKIAYDFVVGALFGFIAYSNWQDARYVTAMVSLIGSIWYCLLCIGYSFLAIRRMILRRTAKVGAM